MLRKIFVWSAAMSRNILVSYYNEWRRAQKQHLRQPNVCGKKQNKHEHVKMAKNVITFDRRQEMLWACGATMTIQGGSLVALSSCVKILIDAMQQAQARLTGCSRLWLIRWLLCHECFRCTPFLRTYARAKTIKHHLPFTLTLSSNVMTKGKV